MSNAPRLVASDPRDDDADASSDAFSVPSTDMATLAPTPCTVCSWRNHSRSRSLANPNNLIWSSRTCVSIDSVAGSPGDGSACSVRAEQCT